MPELPTTQSYESAAAPQHEGPRSVDHISRSDQLFSDAEHGVAAAVNGEVINLFGRDTAPAIWDDMTAGETSAPRELTHADEVAASIDRLPEGEQAAYMGQLGQAVVNMRKVA